MRPMKRHEFKFGGRGWYLYQTQLKQDGWNDLWCVYPTDLPQGGPVIIGRHDGTPRLHSAMAIDFDFYERFAEAFFEGVPAPPLPPPDETAELKTRLAKIRLIAEEHLAEESIDDVKYVMRDLDEILELAGGKKTNGW